MDELEKLKARIDEIQATIELCDVKWDRDVIKNLANELEAINEKLDSCPYSSARSPGLFAVDT